MKSSVVKLLIAGLILLVMGFWIGLDVGIDLMDQKYLNTIAFQSAYIDSLETRLQLDAWEIKQMWDVILEGE